MRMRRRTKHTEGLSLEQLAKAALGSAGSSIRCRMPRHLPDEHRMLLSDWWVPAKITPTENKSHGDS
jgi:hypothetical protein